MKRETPVEWVKLMERKRLHSLRDMATALGISPQTASRLVHGEQTSRDTIERAAELLGVTADRIRELRQEDPRPAFRLPPEADQLGQRQRAAIVAVIRAMLEPADAPAKTRGDEVPLPPIHEVPTETPGLRMISAAYSMNADIARELEVIAKRAIAEERGNNPQQAQG